MLPSLHRKKDADKLKRVQCLLHKDFPSLLLFIFWTCANEESPKTNDLIIIQWPHFLLINSFLYLPFFLILNYSLILSNTDVAVDAVGDYSSDEGVESFSDRGKCSLVGFFSFKLRSAIFDDRGTGIIGTGRISFGDIFRFELLDPNERFSIVLTSATVKNAGLSDSGKVGRVAVSWWTCSSSINEPNDCKIETNMNM